eukprot:8352291-Pyramimonas_sp.AAC.1
MQEECQPTMHIEHRLAAGDGRVQGGGRATATGEGRTGGLKTEDAHGGGARGGAHARLGWLGSATSQTCPRRQPDPLRA